MPSLPPVDPPKAPTRGLSLWVVWGTHRSLGEGYTVTRVNSRSFYVYHQGRQTRRLLVEWDQWLRERFAEGTVLLDGYPVRVPPDMQNDLFGGSPMGTTTLNSGLKIDVRARDRRFLRAAGEVLKRYKIERLEDRDADGALRFAVRGGTRPYEVRVHPDWAAPPTCTCPDAAGQGRALNGGFCKHIIAVLLDDDELGFQLLDVLL